MKISYIIYMNPEMTEFIWKCDGNVRQTFALTKGIVTSLEKRGKKR